MRFAVVACCLLAHGGANAAAPAGRYTVTADTVADNVSGLVWQRNVDANSYSWTSAASFCQSLNLGGWSTGWRLPSVKELQSLRDIRSYAPAMDASAFPGAPLGYFWSSTSYAESASLAWNILFQDGSSGPADKSTTLRVRCVR